LRFAGVLQCMDLLMQDEGEVWWEHKRRSNPEQWARKAVPPESSLYIFTDKSASKPTKKARRPTSRAQKKAGSKPRSRAARR
jgi:hypothetical protein